VPDHLLEAVKKIQDTNLICPPVVSQYAALGALAAGRAYCERMRQEIAVVRDMALLELEQIADLCTVPSAEGAFYLLLRVHTQRRDMELVEALIRDFGVAVMPGSTFGMTGGCYLRVAYGALQRDTAAEGLGRLVRGLRALVGRGEGE